MTDQLQEMMRERADGLETPWVDLDGLMAAGDRRRRRRSGVTIGAVAAVCAVTVFGIVQVSGTPGASKTEFASGAGAFEERRATYASGSTIHYGQDSFDVGEHTVESFVQTDDGFVFADRAGAVYLADAESVERIGRDARDGHLASDDSGSYAAWVDESAGQPRFVVYDTGDRTEVVRTAAGDDGESPEDSGPPFVVAVDGDDAYVVNDEGLARIEIGSGDTRLLRAGVDATWEIPDVADGRILRDTNHAYSYGAGSAPLGSVLNADPNASRPKTAASPRGLSPMATYIATDYEYSRRSSDRIVDSRTNELVRLDTQATHEFQAVSQWVDDDTVVVMTLDGPDANPSMSLSTCELPSGQCRLSAEDLPEGSQLPVGENLGSD